MQVDQGQGELCLKRGLSVKQLDKLLCRRSLVAYMLTASKPYSNFDIGALYEQHERMQNHERYITQVREAGNEFGPLAALLLLAVLLPSFTVT